MAVDALAPYDPGNVFARILRGELPARVVHQDEWAVAFHDITPLAPVHVLVIPRGAYVSLADFSARASDAELAGFWRAVGEVTRRLDLAGGGFRVLTNAGGHAGQEVPHLHVHVFAGAPLGPMLCPDRA